MGSLTRTDIDRMTAEERVALARLLSESLQGASRGDRLTIDGDTLAVLDRLRGFVEYARTALRFPPPAAPHAALTIERPLLREVFRLSIDQRLDLVEAVWGTIEEAISRAVEEEQVAEAERRLREYEANPGETYTWEEVWRAG